MAGNGTSGGKLAAFDGCGLERSIDRGPVFCAYAGQPEAAQERAVVAIERALEARRNRVRLSQVEIAPIQWVVVVVLATLILLTIAFDVHHHVHFFDSGRRLSDSSYDL
jgi:hypothetical protein